MTSGEVISIHEILIEEFGGSNGLRDLGLLESSVNRIYQTFEGKELYPSPVEKAAAIFESLINNHPFIDGNKRIAYVMLRSILLNNKLDINAKESDKYSFVISAASGKMNFTEIKEWIEKNSIENV
ncbi:MAG: type II toxin-antitoxin system death-on-curing family toxin [Ignavibacteria bacterium]|nr:type II toxin-antitoxin system death-on-curing family toxin [Ignavibacteria bacterium]